MIKSARELKAANENLIIARGNRLVCRGGLIFCGDARALGGSKIKLFGVERT